MDAAATAVFFTAAFGVNDLFREVLGHQKNYLRYVLLESRHKHMDTLAKSPYNRVAFGSILGHNAFERWLRRWQEERLTDLNVHVRYIHTKYMLIDPLSDDPIVISGSANFSNASTLSNDENMLVIRGDKCVGDLYLTEFIRLFKHFEFRDIAQARRGVGPKVDSAHLAPDDSWSMRYYRPGTSNYMERVYFAGP
jgi:phosphatidylserine/phosphatidylglycerophosphate/cardiolipin synthase-like enzyme